MLNIKEKLEKAINKVILIGGVATLVATGAGCDENQDEADNKRTIDSVETVKEEPQVIEQDYKIACENFADIKGRHVDYDPKTNICRVIDNNDMIWDGFVSNTKYEFYYFRRRSQYAAMSGCNGATAEESMHHKGFGGDFNHNKARFRCYFEEAKYFMVDVSFTNKLLSLEEWLAKACKNNENCTCRKNQNGTNLCEIIYQEPLVLNGNRNNYESKVISPLEFLPEDMELSPRDYWYVHIGKPDANSDDNEVYKPIKQCLNDSNKFCINYSDSVVIKFNDVMFLDEEYEKCKIKCTEQDSKPVQQRSNFDGNCECKESKKSSALKQAQDKKLAVVQSMFAVKGM